MAATLRFGGRGKEVMALQQRLNKLGFPVGAVDGIFGRATYAALIAFQRSEGLSPDGIAGPESLRALGIEKDQAQLGILLAQVTPASVAEMFPFTRLDIIEKNLPAIKQAMQRYQLFEKPMILTAFGTIRAETETFEPVSEMPSRFNTSPGGRLFDLYDHRRDLGNLGAPDGERFRGRGFVQLTGRANYRVMGRHLGLGEGLLKNPEQANETVIAAEILAAFLATRRTVIKQSFAESDLRRVRRAVNGGVHGFDRFADAIAIGEQILGSEDASQASRCPRCGLAQTAAG